MKVGNEAELIRKLWYERLSRYRERMGGMNFTVSSKDDSASPEERFAATIFEKCIEILDTIYQELEAKHE